MGWLSLKIQADQNNAETMSDALMALGALSATIEDANAETIDEQAIFGEPGDPPPGVWKNSIVSALLAEDTPINALIASLEATLRSNALHYSIERIEEQDWVRATQSQFDPIRIQDHLWIVPSWHDAPNPQAINIVLDPGLAFGTGSHPTTHLCLDWLTKQVLTGKTLLDYGCGSGILAIAAKKLGAHQVVGVDIDPQAIQSSMDNAKQNQENITFLLAKESLNLQADIVVANILSSALMVLAPVLARFCKSGGSIALSGILQEQIEPLLETYAQWFDMSEVVKQDAWVLLTGQRK